MGLRMETVLVYLLKCIEGGRGDGCSEDAMLVFKIYNGILIINQY